MASNSCSCNCFNSNQHGRNECVEQENGHSGESGHDNRNSPWRNGSEMDNEVRIVLIGKTGSGKSTTGNTILNETFFQSSSSCSSVTSFCVSKRANRFGKNIQIVDTPGTFDTSVPNETVQREIVKCIGITSPGPHCFLLVMGLSRFTHEDEKSINHFVNYFGKDVFRYFVVLFTRKDDLDYEGRTLDDHLQTIPQNLKTFIDKCGGRCIAFNNRAKSPEREDQVKDLLEIINGVVRQNHGTCYTNEMYVEAEKVIKARQSEIEKEREREREIERQKIRQEIEQNYRLKMETEIKELKHEINCMKEQAEETQREKDMILQERLELIDQKYEKLQDSRLVARDEVEKGNIDMVEALIKVVLFVGNIFFFKLGNK